MLSQGDGNRTAEVGANVAGTEEELEELRGDRRCVYRIRADKTKSDSGGRRVLQAGRKS